VVLNSKIPVRFVNNQLGHFSSNKFSVLFTMVTFWLSVPNRTVVLNTTILKLSVSLYQFLFYSFKSSIIFYNTSGEMEIVIRSFTGK